MVSVLTLVWPLALPTTVCVTFSFYLKPTLFPFAKCSAHTSGLKLHRQVDNPARTSYRYEGLPCPLFWAASALPQPYRDIVINNNKNNRPARDCLERLCWMVCVRVTLYLPRKQNKPCSDSAWARMDAHRSFDDLLQVDLQSSAVNRSCNNAGLCCSSSSGMEADINQMFNEHDIVPVLIDRAPLVFAKVSSEFEERDSRKGLNSMHFLRLLTGPRN